MFQKSTFFMRVIIILLGLVVLIPCILLVPRALNMLKGVVEEVSMQGASPFVMLYLLFYGAIYMALVPFCIAIYQTLKLLGYIDIKETFSEKSIKALKIIRNCALAILAIYIVGAMPPMCYFSIYDEALLEIIIWVAPALIPMAIAVFASMLGKLIQEAIDIKSENDLTI